MAFTLRAHHLGLVCFALAGASGVSACGDGEDKGAKQAGGGGKDGGNDAPSDVQNDGKPDGAPDSAPDAGPSGIGAACTSEAQCGDPTQYCFTSWPGGYCEAACDPQTPCPWDAKCVTSPQTGDSACLKVCTQDTECRSGYHCSKNRHVCVPQGGFNGGGVTPGTAPDGGACVQPIVNPPGTGAIFGSDKQVSQGLMGAECQLAADPTHNRVVVSWIDVQANGGAKIGAAISDDGGNNFGAPVLLPFDTSVIKGSQQSDPVVAVDPTGNFFVTWISYDQSGQTTTNMNVVVAEAPVGQPFNTFFNVTPADEWTTIEGLDKPWIAASPADGTLFSTWARLSNSGADIRMARSADSGKTWSAPVTVSNSPGGLERNLAQVTVGADGKAYITWVEISTEQFGSTSNHVYLQVLNPDGSTLGPTVEVTQGADSPSFEDPSVAVSGSNVYVGFNSGTSKGDWDIRVAASLDSGVTFLPSVKVNDDATCATHFHHQIAVDGAGNVHAIYYDNRYLVGNLFHQQSPAAATGTDLAFGAATFVNSSSFPFTTSRTNQQWLGDYLGLAVGGNTLHALWTDPRAGSSQIYYAKATLQ